jgi:hypothetical protein
LAPLMAQRSMSQSATVASTGCRATVDAEGRAMVDEDSVNAVERTASHRANADTE